MRLIDAHAHLQAGRLIHEADALLAAARAVGLERAIMPGWDVATSEAGVSLATRQGIDAAVGIHPHVSGTATDADRARIRELVQDPVVRSVGETGLDYDRGYSPRDAQLANLRWHLALARQVGLPLILHCRSKPGRRDAQDDLIEALREADVGDADWQDRLAGRPPAVLHSFSGPVDYAEAALELGCAVSISGLAFRTGEESTAEVARLVPSERLLVETDAPWLSPPGAPRGRNEPRYVEVTARWVAEQRGVDPDVLGDQLVAAYDRTFAAR
ncbi:MAG: TatD family hydrolase [Chloroflexi bacterium]|nr:TatD family hydrolase [Chloroflexota bacterium]